VIVFTTAGNEAGLAGWAADGAEVVALPRSDAGLSFDVILAELGRRRFTNVLVEGGAGLLGSLLDATAADEFHVFVAPKVVGGDRALSPVAGTGVPVMAQALRLTDFTAEPSGDDIYLHGFAPRTG
jgi:diaminohydroxyphosphoribosylaminopyrimidine deaminase/5-amino-6-(5-phosphoribosylamino)uracil reductase